MTQNLLRFSYSIYINTHTQTHSLGVKSFKSEKVFKRLLKQQKNKTVHVVVLVGGCFFL